jgi:hypothetical protein
MQAQEWELLLFLKGGDGCDELCNGGRKVESNNLLSRDSLWSYLMGTSQKLPINAVWSYFIIHNNKV